VTADLREAKRILRARVLSARDALSAVERAQASRSICKGILASAEYQRATRILAYVGFGTELDTTAITQAVLASGRMLILPRVDKARRALALHRVDDIADSLITGTWGIREPDPKRCPEVDPGEIEFVLVPGVAFSRACERLGYGAGYYDRLIPLLRRQPPLIAGAYALQLVDTVPTGPDDALIDRIVTEHEVVER